MEHGEKLAGMVALRELNNSRAQASPTSPTLVQYNPGELSGAQWDMVQLVGDKARRNNVVLMDRDKVEVFYTRVSELEELFACIQQHAAVLVQRDQSVRIQIERACELASVCSTVLQVAISYRDTQQGWYPSPEGLTPWFCKQTVRAGVWKVATMLLELKVEANMSEPTLTEEVMRQVEEWLDLNNGCLCCSVRDTGLSAILSLMEKKGRFDHIVLETTGLADPAPIIQAFWNEPALCLGT